MKRTHTEHDIYQEVTDTILAKLDEGVAPWDIPWDRHQNLFSGHQYRGVNPMLLELSGHTTPYWMTYNQARNNGGQVRKGEHATYVIVAKQATRKETDENGQEQRRAFFFLRYIPVFNLDQVDGIEAPEKGDIDPIAAAEAIIAGYADSPPVDHVGDSAHYIPREDRIELPPVASFHGMEAYYATRFHESVHSTGHASRVGRPGVVDFDAFGTEQYAEEELVAEFGAAFLSAEAGIKDTTIERSAAYIKSWSERLRGDKHLAVRAASAGGKAADYILGRAEEKREEVAA